MRYTCETIFHGVEFLDYSARQIGELLHFVWAETVGRSAIDDTVYTQDWGFELIVPTDHQASIAVARKWIDRIASARPDIAEALSDLPMRLEAMAEMPITELLQTYMSEVGRISKYLDFAGGDHTLAGVRVAAENDFVVFSLPSRTTNADALEIAPHVIRRIATQNRLPTITEFVSLAAAAHHIARGRNVRQEAVQWGSPGFRPHQTVMSITEIRGSAISTERAWQPTIWMASSSISSISNAEWRSRVTRLSHTGSPCRASSLA